MTSLLAQTQGPPRTEAEMISAGIALLRDRLPAEWPLNVDTQRTFALESPEGRELEVAVEARRSLQSRDIPRIKRRLDGHIGDRPAVIGMVMARYLSKSTREHLREAGLSYVDATGNLFVQADSPAIFISDRGADNDPWRGPGRPRATLKGAPAAKVVRTLLDFCGPWRISDLVKRSATSTGSVYRVLDFLESEALVLKDENGQIFVPDWQALLRRWGDDYQFLKTNSTTKWIAPRGIESFLKNVRDGGISQYAMTGSVAADTWAPYAPARSAMAYCIDVERCAEAWGLRATDTGANVILATPAFEVLMDRAIDRPDGIRVAAPTQVAADLLTGPGRAPAEGEALMDWMAKNEKLWR